MHLYKEFYVFKRLFFSNMKFFNFIFFYFFHLYYRKSKSFYSEKKIQYRFWNYKNSFYEFVYIVHYSHLLLSPPLEWHTTSWREVVPNNVSKSTHTPGWCGSVDWVLTCKPEGPRFDSQFRAHAWVAGQVPSRGPMRGNHTLTFLCLSFSLPSFLKVNKTFF